MKLATGNEEIKYLKYATNQRSKTEIEIAENQVIITAI